MERELFVRLIGLLDALPQARRRPPKGRYTDRDIILVWLWAVLHDRPIDWACRRENWPWHDRKRPLPSGSTMSRRLRDPAIADLVRRLLRSMRVACRDGSMTLIVDGKPLTVSGNSADRDVGFGRACGLMGKGYRLMAITDLAGNVWAFSVQCLKVSEQAATLDLLAELGPRPGTVLLGDGNFDCNKLYERAGENGIQLVAARRYKHARGVGHHRHSEHRLRALVMMEKDPYVLWDRRRIEGVFGTLGNVVGGLSPLPNAVRGLRRVERWVTGKLIIDALHRLRRKGTRIA